MKIGDNVKFTKPICQGIRVIEKETKGILVERPHWYVGITSWDYYVEIDPYVVAGVTASEIEEQEIP